jgi:subtilisin family serine protease
MKFHRQITASFIVLIGLLSVAAVGKTARSARPEANEAAARAKAQPEGAIYDVYHAMFQNKDDCQAFAKAHSDYPRQGIYVYDTFERFADLFVRPDQGTEETVKKLIEDAHGMWDEAGTAYAPPPRAQLTPNKPRSEPERIFRGDKTLKGKGVIVAVVDTGIDYRHPDFIVERNGKPVSRLLYFWDTTVQPSQEKAGSRVPVKYPDGRPIGSIYTQEELTAVLQAAAAQPPVPISPEVGDVNGHGTACAGIAAGNGCSTPGREFAGVAPEADLIAVRIGGAGRGLNNAYLLSNIYGWIDQVARQRHQPVVISCSFGGAYGGHDGSLIGELQLDARLPLDRAGRALCAAAGNDGYEHLHAEAVLQGGDNKAVLAWKLHGDARSALIDINYNTRTPADVHVEQQPGISIGWHRVKANGYVQTRVYATGSGQLTMVRTSKEPIALDAYISENAEFVPVEPPVKITQNKLIDTPGSTANAITVGSYDWNDNFPLRAGLVLALNIQVRQGDSYPWVAMEIGKISAYSSEGPCRLQAKGAFVKPDIVAPGQYFVAPAARQLSYNGVLTQDRRYWAFNGTSAATPYVAGVIALMFEKNGTLTLRDIKTAFKEHATKNADVERYPDLWGNGKLDGDAVRNILDAVSPAR